MKQSTIIRTLFVYVRVLLMQFPIQENCYMYMISCLECIEESLTYRLLKWNKKEVTKN